MDWTSYPGKVGTATVDRVTVDTFTPGDTGYSRHVTTGSFIPPVKLAGWARLSRWHGPRTTDSAVYDGLHIHLGHVGNDRNYTVTLVRRDGNTKIAVEYGWLGYESLAYSRSGPELVDDRVYLFEILWLPNKITSWVASEAGVHTMSAKVPERRRIPAGQVGFRLDNFQASGQMTVRSV